MKYETKRIEIILKKVRGQVISSTRFLEPQLVLQCSVEMEEGQRISGAD